MEQASFRGAAISLGPAAAEAPLHARAGLAPGLRTRSGAGGHLVTASVLARGVMSRPPAQDVTLDLQGMGFS
jgi:hypothetical protein